MSKNRIAWLVAGVALAQCGLVLAANPQGPNNDTVIVVSTEASPLETLGAREVQRYVYLRTGQLLPIQAVKTVPEDPAQIILVMHRDQKLARSIELAAGDREILAGLSRHEYWLKSLNHEEQRILLLAGGDAVGTLYAAYHFAETLGVRFYLHGDVLPDDVIPLELPVLDQRAKPLFELRGIQPFHDFPEGPDWWNTDDYQAVIGQLPKLRMNFFGLHTYPEKGPNAEPTVWIGRPEDLGAKGQVRFSYPASYQNTLRGNWGYEAKPTSRFTSGLSGLFERDDFGAEVMSGYSPEPKILESCNAVFDRTGTMLREAFTFAHRLGVQTCVGTETPLTVPQRVKGHLQAQDKNTADPSVLEELYEGIFRRIMQTYPLDYYWFWTPEGWTWSGTKAEDVQATVKDLQAAIRAARKVGAPFQLATCGWVLGPPSDRALFDKILPKTVSVSCINRQVGKDPVEPGFAQVNGRGKWAIPWLEDDPALTSPQLWVGRMRQDAVDSRQYGCNGLMGIHWRTRVLGPNISALAKAAWDQNWKSEPAKPASRFQPSHDFYADWALIHFGASVSEAAATIFARLDGNLPRPSDWVDGPGGLRPDARPWSQVSPEYAFVDEFAALRPKVHGAGQLERFDYWLHTFQYLRAMGRLNCIWAEYNRALDSAKKADGDFQKQQLAKANALPLRRQLVHALSEVYEPMIATVSTPGELGTVANWEQHVQPGLITRPGDELAKLLGESLPPEAQPVMEYHGPTRVIVPTVRSSIAVGEHLQLKVMILSEQEPREAALYWRPLGPGKFVKIPLTHLARGVYQVNMPPPGRLNTGIEYLVQAVTPAGDKVNFPATAPQLNQTLVVMP